jgi:hypothetical protein
MVRLWIGLNTKPSERFSLVCGFSPLPTLEPASVAVAPVGLTWIAEY